MERLEDILHKIYIPSGVVAVGNPATVIGKIEDSVAKKEREIYPAFGEEYTNRKSITNDMKNEMNEKMLEKFG
jgi:hypothetical protein